MSILSTLHQPTMHDVVPLNAFVASPLGDFHCAACPASVLNVCAAVRQNGEPKAIQCHRPPLLAASVHTSPARRTICHPTEWSDFVPIVCHGWATSSVALPDGRRQILSFLLPGDMFSMASLFEPMTSRLVEAVTEVTYRNYKRSDLKAILIEYPDVLETISKAWIEWKGQSDQLVVDLGCRTADERIARLILNLMERLAKRGMAQDRTMEFPLRQHHIADATGLTSVHVSRVLSEFRRSGLIEISNRSLTVLDPTEFCRVANMQ
jgi:CRP/FNR family transcriptional regulator